MVRTLVLLLIPSSEAVRLLSSTSLFHNTLIKNENKVFLIYMEIQMGGVAKSYILFYFLSVFTYSEFSFG
jgi:hypothetical protein